jgi:hypothetical protein
MIPTALLKLAAAGAFAAGLCVASTASAQQPASTAPLEVSPAHPTSVTISIAGKEVRTVRKEVDAAAYFVCRNFVGVKGIALDDVDWCADRSSTIAMKQYAAIVRSHSLADAGTIVLSAR